MKKNIASALIALAFARGFLKFRSDKPFEDSVTVDSKDGSGANDSQSPASCCGPTELCCE